ncbi:Hypothetical protein MVR_LOCUS108 [uncultured virus]|nr:Hypothetical protein MVR_LOCUS108 [uncultured virus]
MIWLAYDCLDYLAKIDYPTSYGLQFISLVILLKPVSTSIMNQANIDLLEKTKAAVISSIQNNNEKIKSLTRSIIELRSMIYTNSGINDVALNIMQSNINSIVVLCNANVQMFEASWYYSQATPNDASEVVSTTITTPVQVHDRPVDSNLDVPMGCHHTQSQPQLQSSSTPRTPTANNDATLVKLHKTLTDQHRQEFARNKFISITTKINNARSVFQELYNYSSQASQTTAAQSNTATLASFLDYFANITKHVYTETMAKKKRFVYNKDQVDNLTIQFQSTIPLGSCYHDCFGNILTTEINGVTDFVMARISRSKYLNNVIYETMSLLLKGSFVALPSLPTLIAESLSIEYNLTKTNRYVYFPTDQVQLAIKKQYVCFKDQVESITPIKSSTSSQVHYKISLSKMHDWTFIIDSDLKLISQITREQQHHVKAFLALFTDAT